MNMACGFAKFTQQKLFPSLFGVTEGKNQFIRAPHLSNIKRYYTVYRYML